ncbi:MAG TPA: D-aminoacylase [Caulobacteraceae bacterium]|nr:D-aminoacylase [Caulobacteraceae bacterium]
MTVDLVIRNAKILDGAGGPAFEGDVAVDGGRIAAVGRVTDAAREEIDAGGQHLAPGFVDVHAHDDGAFIRHPDMAFKLAQGVTTCVCGNCGFSAIPAVPGADPAVASGGILAGLEGDFTDLEGYFAAALGKKPAINNIMLVGHNTVRATVMGFEQRAPTAAELAEMKVMVRRAFEQGACGFSTGLIYRPGRWSQTDEVIALAEEAAPFGALYTTHMRNEGDRLLEAVDEALTIGREAGVHAHISHHKSAGRRNWGKVGSSLAKIDQAKAAGQKVTLDVYPYTAGSGRMIEYFNLDRVDRELAEVIRIASCPAFREFEGRMLVDIAAERGIDVTEAVKLVLTAPAGDRTICIQFIIDEADVETNLRYPTMMVGSDGIPELRGRPHPRLFGTFPRVLGEYVRRRHVLPLEEAVHRMTQVACETFGLVERGAVREGFHADLVLFDAGEVSDLATYDDPKREPAGISLVVVNGQIACRNGAHTAAGSGQMLRYRRSAFREG